MTQTNVFGRRTRIPSISLLIVASSTTKSWNNCLSSRGQRFGSISARRTVNRGVCVSVLSILAEAGGSPSLSAVVRQGAERGSAG
jgi:hypothetical protein